jgi:hypothetical protein
VNGLYPPLDHLDDDPMEAAKAAGVRLTSAEADALREAARFRRGRRRLHTEQLARLADALPLPQIHLPFLFTTDLRPAEVDVLAAAMASEIGGLDSVAADPTSRATEGKGASRGRPSPAVPDDPAEATGS